MALEQCERKLSSYALDVLSQLRADGIMCDGVLRTEDGGEFQVHRLVMLACSPYFYALYASPFNTTQKTTILIPGISVQMLWQIIHYAYTRATNVCWENVYQILESADQFNVIGMLDDCCRFLMTNMNAKNCLDIRRMIKQYYCKELKEFTERFLTVSFEDIAKENAFLQLDANEVTEIFNIENLNIKCEEMLWEIGLSWINSEPLHRSKYITDILKSVRLGLMNPDYFVEKVKANPYVSENELCRPIVIEAMKCLFDLDLTDGTRDASWSLIQHARIPYEIAFAIGGWSGGSATGIIETYDPRTDMWIMVCPQDTYGPRAYHKCAVVGNYIYVIGGFDGIEYFNSCRCFDAVSYVWKEISPMYYRRCYVSVAVTGNVIYALGGNEGQKRLNSAERYFCDINQWQLIAQMNYQRSDASAAALSGLVYITGGFNGSDCLNSAEFYDPQSNQWTLISSMRTRRSGVSCVSYQGYIYVLGGFNGISRLANGEKYNPINDSWTSVPDMLTTRSNFASMVIDDFIFVVGGFDGTQTISSVECYDPKTEKWIRTEDMGLSRSALSACILKGLPNVKDYIPARDSALYLMKRQKLQALQSSASTTI